MKFLFNSNEKEFLKRLVESVANTFKDRKARRRLIRLSEKFMSSVRIAHLKPSERRFLQLLVSRGLGRTTNENTIAYLKSVEKKLDAKEILNADD